ncbi:MAG TPA: right-handed parallel beta-helix repeat-containing protein [Solirubrobacterales bacterium]
MFFVVLCIPTTASATGLPATIKENTTLAPTGNPYTGTSTIEAGVTLIVEPGVKFSEAILKVQGTLKAEGTAGSPILFEEESQQVIVFEPGSGGSVLDHAEFIRGGHEGPLNSSHPAVMVEKSSPTITNSTFRAAGYYTIHVPNGGSPIIANNNFINGHRAPIYYHATTGQSGEINIHGNSIEAGENTQYGGGIEVSVSGSTVTSKTLGENSVSGTPQAGVSYTGPAIPVDVTENSLSGENAGFIDLSGTVASSTSWNGNAVLEANNVTVASGVTLGVSPGVRFKESKMTVNGTLKAEGTVESPIVFGEEEEQAIVFEPGSGASVLSYVEIIHGGHEGPLNSSHPAVMVEKSSPTIANSTFRNAGYYAIQVPNGGGPEIANNNFMNSERTSIYYHATTGQSGEVNIHGNSIEAGTGTKYGDGIDINASGSTVSAKTLSVNTVTGMPGAGISYTGPDIPGNVTENTLVGNANNVIEVGGTVAHSTTWKDGGSMVEITSNVTVASGVTLSIAPNVYLSESNFVINGTLKAEGTSEKPIVFEGNTASAITFEPGSGASVLDYVEVISAGHEGPSNTSRSAIWVKKSSPAITHSTFRDEGYYAIQVPDGGSPVIANDNFLNGEKTPIYYRAGTGETGEINIHDNYLEAGESTKYGGGIDISVTGSTVATKTLSGNTVIGTPGVGITYSGPDIPGNITENTLVGNKENVIEIGGTVASSSTWKKGTPVRLTSATVASGVTLKIARGVLMTHPTVTVKGTLITEGTAAEPVVFTGEKEETPGEWGSIKFEAGSGESVLDYTEVAFGGSASSSGVIEAKGSHPTITHSTIRKAKYYGIKITESGSPKVEWNRFRSNANGLSYSGTGKFFAPHNDWGCSNGPKPSGCGDSVTTNVEWKPAAELPELAGHCRGKESQCGEGADPVSLATGALDYSHRDLLLTNKSRVPLEFTRFYSSASSVDTGMGPGWAQNGIASASEEESGEVLVVRPDGRQDVFIKTESGYKAPSGVTDKLSKVEGTFKLTTLQNTVYAFDSSGRIASITDDHGLKTTYAYSAEGRLSTITDPSGQTLAFTYNSSNHMTLVKDSTGREVKYAYSAAGDLEAVTDALGGVTKYGYDGQHRLTSITDPKGNVILKNVYDPQDQITEQEDGLKDLWKLSYSEGQTVVTEPQGGKLTYSFDGQDRVVSETDQLGHKTTTAYDAAGNVSEVVQPGGAKWIYGHDAAGNLTSVKDPEGGERKYEYDGQNRLTSFTDARGNTWKYEWSKANDLTKVTDPEGGETTLSYNGSGQPLTVTDPAKHKTEFSYDTRGNRLSVTDPISHKTSYEYNSRNYLTAETLPGLKAESFERNALGDMLARTTPEGNKTKYSYDSNGLPTQVTDPAENVWKIAYNAMERPILYTDPEEGKTEISYNGDLKPTKVTNRRGKATTYGYDAANQLTEVDRPEGEDWAYGYDLRGNRSSMVDPRGYETTYEYDALNRMIQANEPLEVTTKYGYDANGELTSLTDPLSHKTTYAYDKLGRMIEVAQPLEKITKYGYDAAGNKTSKTTAAGTLEYGYDEANLLTSIKAGGSTLRSYGYDSANRRTSATDAEGHKIEIGYDNDSRIASIKDGRGQSISRTFNSRGLLAKSEDGRGTTEYGYDKLGRETSLTDPQGKTLSFSFNPEGDLTEIKRPNGVTTANLYNDAGSLAETTSKDEGGTVLEALKYSYDAEGNVTSRLDTRAETETAYAYDKLGRLTEFNPPGEGSTAYGYDKAGNRTEASGTTYEFNALNQLVKASGGTAYAYDKAGRMVSKESEAGKTSYEWDLFDHLAKAEGSSETANYAYDALERLSERKVGGSTQIVHYGDLSDTPTYDANGEGKTTTSYVAGPKGLLEERSAEATSYPLTDAHGDVTAIAGLTGIVESRQEYGPWGERLSGPSLKMGYLGAYERPTDTVTGLIQMGARSYSPELGAFMSEDPVLGHIGLGISANRYPYAWDNPLNRYDLNGRDVIPSGPICILACPPDPPKGSSPDRAHDFEKGQLPEVSEAGIDDLMYKAAGDAFRFADRWAPERLEKAWKCGFQLSKNWSLEKCDPFELFVEEPESAY